MQRDQPTPKLKEKARRYPSVIAGVYFIPAKESSLNLKKFSRPFQPLAEKTPEGNKLRRESFHSCDGNGTGYCSLSDVESFVLTMLNKEYGHADGEEIFKYFRPSYIRAFSAAKTISKGTMIGPSSKDRFKGKVDEDDYVTFNEFRVLNAYLCIYAAMIDAFTKVDGGGQGHVDIDDDRRVEKKEWMTSYSLLHNYGFAGLAEIQDDGLATIAFDTMDSDDKGLVLFREFCEYVRDTEMKSRSDLGKLLSGQIAPITPKAAPNKVNTSRVPAGSSTSKVTIVVAEAWSPGSSASPELLDFLRVFQPLAEKTLVGKKDRQKHFSSADQNRTGYVALAEIEIFVKRALSSSFPKTKAKDLFLRYRKCYIKAFHCAKSLHESEDTHADSPDEQYVTFSEFRLFIAYLCIYSGMYDAFATINEKEDRIDFKEFMDSYKFVRDSGFVALSSLNNPSDATDTFDNIDTDDSQQISFGEWADFIIDKEIEADTELGKLMLISRDSYKNV